MKKRILTLLLCFVIFFSLMGCKKEVPEKIVLSFDRAEAYFSGSVELYPITGVVLTDNDVYEEAEVILRATVATRMCLSIGFAEQTDIIEGLMIKVGETGAKQMLDGVILYESNTEETEAVLNIKIYLSKDSPDTNKGKTFTFNFVLSQIEEED